MNQDQVKEKLLLLDGTTGDFSVIFSGKTSKKVDGLYYPDRKEIIIHNRNCADDSQLMYTAIHEFAHHVHQHRSAVPLSSRAHTVGFWDIFHKLLFTAEEKGIYVNIFKMETRFVALTRKIRENYLSTNGDLMKDLGSLLAKAYELCDELNASFDDYVDRELLLHRTTAKLLVKIHSLGIRSDIGYENMKTVARIKDDKMRARAEEAFAEGKTADMVKTEFIRKNGPDERLDMLVQERDRIERSIENLTRKLAQIERKINEMKHDSKPAMSSPEKKG
jgi:hypothetical protein